jgi:anti-sigma B factor antagonist
MTSQPREIGVEESLPPIEVAEIRIGHRIVLAVSGELDIATAPALQSSLNDAVDNGLAELWVDLRDVTFMDSTGLRVLLAIRRRLREKSKTLVVICPDGPVRRVFTVAGLDDEFSIYADRAAAHAAG